MADLPITSYITLRDAVADFIDRADLEDRIPIFVQLAEAHFNRFLRTMRQLTRATADTDQQFTELPDGWLEGYNMQINESGRTYPLIYKAPHEVDAMRNSLYSTRPLYYTHIGRNIELLPAPSALVTVEMVYYKKLTPLDSASDTSTNWLLDSHPDVYLYGVLAQAAKFVKDPDALQEANALLSGAMAELADSDQRARASGGPINSSPGTSFRIPRRIR